MSRHTPFTRTTDGSHQHRVDGTAVRPLPGQRNVLWNRLVARCRRTRRHFLHFLLPHLDSHAGLPPRPHGKRHVRPLKVMKLVLPDDFDLISFLFFLFYSNFAEAKRDHDVNQDQNRNAVGIPVAAA